MSDGLHKNDLEECEEEKRLQQYIHYDFNNLNKDQKKEFEQVSAYWKLNNPKQIEKIFETAAMMKLEMARKIIHISLKIICKLNVQIHILNKSFRSCLLRYSKWRTHTESNDRSICIKMDYNILIMVHQIKQIDKYFTAKDDDPWKAKLLDALRDTEFKKDFMQCFYRMYNMFFMLKNLVYYLNLYYIIGFNGKYLCTMKKQRCDEKFIRIFDIFMDWDNNGNLWTKFDKFRWFGVVKDDKRLKFWMSWAETPIPALALYLSLIHI